MDFSLLSVENIKTLSFYFGILFTLIFVLRTFLPLDFSPEMDTTGSFGTDSGFALFSLESIVAFLMTAAWMNFLSLKLGYSLKLSLIVALLTGFFAMALFAFLIAQFKKLEQTKSADLKELTGKTGKAYMDFKPFGTSKIQIGFNSKLEILDAKNASDAEIKAFNDIKVTKIENEIIYIEKI